jgi:hypothetical protein
MPGSGQWTRKTLPRTRIAATQARFGHHAFAEARCFPPLSSFIEPRAAQVDKALHRLRQRRAAARFAHAHAMLGSLDQFEPQQWGLPARVQPAASFIGQP